MMSSCEYIILREITLTGRRRVLAQVPRGWKAPCDGRVRFDGLPTEEPERRRRTRSERLVHLQARALLFAARDTLCSTTDIADIFGLREARVRAVRPDSAIQVGRAWMAPFSDWLEVLDLGDAPASSSPKHPAPARRRPVQPRRSLRPLGGPGRSS